MEKFESGSDSVHEAISQAAPPSLESLCLEFVAAHVEWVESWRGIGDHMAKRIFTRMVEQGHADRIVDASVRIKPFRDTFGPVLQSRVNFLASNRLLNELLDIYELLSSHLTFLDLSGCALGSAHPIFSTLAEMSNLRCLVMRGCRLNDDSLRRLTLPISMTGRGPVRLFMLDISRNPLITERSLPKIKAFRQLRKINVEGTRLGLPSLELGSDSSGGGCETAVTRSLREIGLVSMPAIIIRNNGWIAESGLWNRWRDLFEKSVHDIQRPPSKRLRLL
ncbi:leucine-rich repeat-containing protein 42-like [Varroa jacobsoni]|uniref:leucine-rich repeat-containing protein 42-like n=1 Tax=Varroa jacobsoni TaxID=62625 RepID=UPI000BF7F342|nr:leucine-rich repeat-containing protein 42-like [Varroa jacobsoni]XP_022704904.1 leucine-rich repeat-containing protein 42-like [Varroa jacobsoni]XP_022704905.1 leucine-rich repeat-containing protein 42-like [Varroa jacobsoni]XP_022704906.1 leucine-rich repeat-containing protein 42-like [Varroa jacobsoni]XP_022704907.1 leucine-rich repeat-containing protein 42-like [Varroa jacobsoni]XP_022704908.1 leucine-rich repeat-containing protein 42-like [Varroa jacobsoni]